MRGLVANLTMLFGEYDFYERFDRAAEAGFRAVEFFFPYQYDSDLITEALKRNDLELVLFNLPLGDWDAGDRGFVAQVDRTQEFRDGLELAVEHAKSLHPALINTPSGPAPDSRASFNTLVENVRVAADALAEVGVGMVIEPINRHDVPGAFVSTVEDTLPLLEAVDSNNLGIQYDLYHSMRSGENPLAVLKEHLHLIKHIQIADVPGRHQPGTGEIDFNRFFAALDEGSYPGWVSLEYHPEGSTESSLDAIRASGLLTY